MTTTKPEITAVAIHEELKVEYTSRRFLIFSWWVVKSVESQGKKLVIETKETYDKIFLNGEELTHKH